MPDAAHLPSKDDGRQKPQAALCPKISLGENTIKVLEALSSPAPISKSDMPDSDRSSANLEDYSRGLSSIDIRNLVDILKTIRFTNEPLIAADIGGYSGTAALDLENLGFARCFVIDPADARKHSTTKLPSNRFIQRVAENMHGVPEGCFHLIVSHNSLSYSDDLSTAILEIFRVLRPGGFAIIDIECWSTEKHLETLKNLHLPDKFSMDLLYKNREEDRIDLLSLAKALQLTEGCSEIEQGLMGIRVGTGFILQKRN